MLCLSSTNRWHRAYSRSHPPVKSNRSQSTRRMYYTLLYTLNHSGWWSILSAFKATRVMKPKAYHMNITTITFLTSLKSLKRNCFLIASLPSTNCHPLSNRGFNNSSLSASFKLCQYNTYYEKTTKKPTIFLFGRVVKDNTWVIAGRGLLTREYKTKRRPIIFNAPLENRNAEEKDIPATWLVLCFNSIYSSS